MIPVRRKVLCLWPTRSNALKTTVLLWLDELQTRPTEEQGTIAALVPHISLLVGPTPFASVQVVVSSYPVRTDNFGRLPTWPTVLHLGVLVRVRAQRWKVRRSLDRYRR